MILADTSVWVAHFRKAIPRFAALLEEREVLGHPFVTGEIAMGSLRNRRQTLGLLFELQTAAVANVAEVAALIEWAPLHGTGIGYVDAHLLASVRLTADARLWTLDKRLHAAAERMSIEAIIIA